MANKEATETPVVPTARPIKDFKEAVVAVAAGVVFAQETAKTKKLDWNKAFVLFAKLNTGVEGYDNILPEAFDIDSAEGKEVTDAVVAELGIANEKAKPIVVAIVAALPANLELYKAIANATKGTDKK